MSENWFKHGVTEEDVENVKKEVASRRKSPLRLWLNEKESKKIIILDDQPFSIWEHHMRINGKWGNFFSCPKGFSDDVVCPICMSGNNRQFSAFISVIDCTGYKNKKGETAGKYSRTLFAMPETVLDRFLAYRAKHTTLVGALIEIQRTSEKAPRLGDVWEVLKTGIDVEKDEKLWWKSREDGKKHPPEPFDYKKIFAPKTASELQALASGAYSGDDDEKYSGGGNSDYKPPKEGGDDDVIY
jgi:hypothetical protein